MLLKAAVQARISCCSSSVNRGFALLALISPQCARASSFRTLPPESASLGRLQGLVLFVQLPTFGRCAFNPSLSPLRRWIRRLCERYDKGLLNPPYLRRRHGLSRRRCGGRLPARRCRAGACRRAVRGGACAWSGNRQQHADRQSRANTLTHRPFSTTARPMDRWQFYSTRTCQVRSTDCARQRGRHPTECIPHFASGPGAASCADCAAR